MESGDNELKVVQQTIEQIRTVAAQDGGNLELLSFNNDIVKVQMSGACGCCHLAGQTLGGIRRQLTEMLGRPIRVYPAWKEDLIEE